MTDLSGVSDADLLASLPQGIRTNNPLNLKDTSGQFRSFASSDDGLAAADANLAAYGTKHGINTIDGVVNRWAPASDGNDPAAYAAHVSRRTGIDPAARISLADPATRQKLLGAMGEFENGAPVTASANPDLSKVSDADLLASLGQSAPPAAPKPPPMPGKPIVAQKQPPPVSGGMDALLGGAAGAKRGMGSLLDQVAAFVPGLNVVERAFSGGNPLMADPMHSQGTIFQRLAGDYSPQTLLGKVAKSVGTMLPNVAVPGSIPQRAANVVLPGVGSELAKQAAKGLGAGDLGQQIASTVGAVAGGGAASLRMTPAAARNPNILNDVSAARDAAYARVRAQGDVIPRTAMRSLSSTVSDLVQQTAGPDGAAAYPAAHAMAGRLQQMSRSRGGVTLPQLDTLRSDIYDALIGAGDREAPLGVAMRQHIDDTIAGTGNPDILAARDLHTRATKIGTIQDEVQSARLRASTTNSGQNGNNSIRQELRPLIDPTRNQQITNFSPDEMAAMTRAVSGSPGQNAMRDASNILRNRFLQGAVAIPTKLLGPAAMEAGGRLLNHAAENSTVRNVQRAIDLIAAGGPNRAAAPIVAQRAQPLLSAPNSDAMTIAGLLSALPAMSSARPRQRSR